jgi:hypothetical protein
MELFIYSRKKEREFLVPRFQLCRYLPNIAEFLDNATRNALLGPLTLQTVGRSRRNSEMCLICQWRQRTIKFMKLSFTKRIA